jgi:hypothetical protein
VREYGDAGFRLPREAGSFEVEVESGTRSWNFLAGRGCEGRQDWGRHRPVSRERNLMDVECEEDAER